MHAEIPDSDILAMEFRDAVTVFLAELRPQARAVIGVAGPDAGEALSALWRRGFKRSRLAAPGRPSAAPAFDALLVAGARGVAQVDSIVATMIGSLGRGTRLGLDLTAMPVETDGAALIRSLSQLGFVARPACMPNLMAIAERTRTPFPQPLDHG